MNDYDDDLHAAWMSAALRLVKEYRAAVEEPEVRSAMHALRSHLIACPASYSGPRAEPKMPTGYRVKELPPDYTGRVWIEGQVRRYGEACKGVTYA